MFKSVIGLSMLGLAIANPGAVLAATVLYYFDPVGALANKAKKDAKQNEEGGFWI